MNHFPESFERRMREQLGSAWEAFANAHSLASPVSIRLNPKKKVNIDTSAPIPWCATGYYLDTRPSFTLDPAFHAGSYYVQEASSMFLEQAFLNNIDSSADLTVLDLCAAPGGKSTHLATLMSSGSLLVSNEVIRSRASVLAENIQKWGYPNVVVTNNDPEHFQRLPALFDVIVVDAPCSGEGLFRKDPGAMNEWTEDNVILCSKRQRRILSDVWPALREGGILIYSTCTYNNLENEDNLNWLKNEKSVEFIPVKTEQNWNVEEVSVDGVTGYRFFPHNVMGEGFFVSVVRKAESQNEGRLKSKNSFTSPGKKIIEQLQSWVSHPEDKTFILRNDLIQFLPKENASIIEYLSRNLHIITAGTAIAELKHEKLIPAHAAALSTELNQENFKTLDVDLADALQFLRKEPMQVLPSQKGHTLVRYNGLPIGWANVLDNRINNLYPSEWRIRMSSK